MSSTLKSQTARANGAKSRGPKTQDGKAKSSANSLRHGLQAKALVLPVESAAAFRELLDAYMKEFDPQTPSETHLVEDMAAARWRLNRVQRYETAMFEDQLESNTDYFERFGSGWDGTQRAAWSFKNIRSSLNLVLRYEGAMNRAYYRALKELRELQKARLAAPPAVRRQPQPRPEVPFEALPFEPCATEAASPMNIPVAAPVQPPRRELS
jgi:hypothetical protein